VRYLFLSILLHTLVYGAKVTLLKNSDIVKEFQEYQIRSIIYPSYPPYRSYVNADYIPLDLNINEKLSAPQKKLAEDFLYTQAFMVSTVVALWFMPESISKWDKNALEEKSLSDRWKEHVKVGPVWDKDEFFINYVGHPVSGAWYYMAARDCGISSQGSFFYSVFLSSFVWEYGYEAFAEVPSWQDLFSTPIVGSFMGEGFYYLEKKIDKNRGKVFGSKMIGDVSYFLLNPIGNISNGLSDFFDIHATFRLQAYQPYKPIFQNMDHLLENRPIVASGLGYGFVLEIQY